MELPSKWHGESFSEDAYAYHQRKGEVDCKSLSKKWLEEEKSEHKTCGVES